MKLRNVSLFVAVVAATTACKRASDGPTPQPVGPVTEAGKPDRAPGAAPAADPWSNPEPQKDPLKKPLFWSIERDGKTSYLLGTMHLGVDPTTRLPEIVWQKLDAAPTFAMETDLAGAGKLDVTRKDGKTLKDELGEVYWNCLLYTSPSPRDS